MLNNDLKKTGLTRIDLQLFADGGGDGGGQGAGGGDGGGAGAGAGTGGQGGGQGGGQAQPFATFPDEASFMARIAREGKAQLEGLAKQLGFDTVEAMQEAAKAKREADEASKTELEKEKAAREKAEKEKQTALDSANKRLVDAEIRLAAQGAGFADYTDAVALIDRTNVKVDDKGDVTGVKEAVEALAKAKPHLLGKGGKPDGSPGSTGNGGRQGGGNEGGAGELGKRLAEKNSQNTKGAVDGQKHYFG